MALSPVVYRSAPCVILAVVAALVLGLADTVNPPPPLPSEANLPASLPERTAPTPKATTRVDVTSYPVKNGDTWESISKEHYFTEKCAAALREYNKRSSRADLRKGAEGILSIGDTVVVPAMVVLENEYGLKLPALDRERVVEKGSPSAPLVPVKAEDVPPPPPPLRDSLLPPSLPPLAQVAPPVGGSVPPPIPGRAEEKEKPAPLVTRHIQLNLAGAELLVSAAKAKAREMKLAISIAVVDVDGHLLAFARMDSASKDTVATALKHAEGKTGLSVAEKKTNNTVPAGAPIVVEKQRVGYIALSLANADQDKAITAAALQALLDALKKEQ